MYFGEDYHSMVAAGLCLILYLIFWRTYPSALTFFFISTKAVAAVEIPIIGNYARLLFLLLAVLTGSLAVKSVSSASKSVYFRLLFTSYGVLFWVVVAIWAKVAVEIIVGGLDEFRLASLMITPVQVVLPTLILMLAFLTDDFERVVKGVFLGMVAFPLACLVPLLPSLVADGSLVEAMHGQIRLVIWNLDTIQSGQFLSLGALGAMGLAVVYRKRPPVIVVMWLLVLGFLYLLLLNGTRQLMLSCMIGFALVVFYYLGRLRLGLVPVIFVMALVAGFVVKRSAETVFADRVAGTALQHELSLSRGAIWADAFEQMRARPLFGVGFRNYGAYNLAYNEETGQIVESKDNAHGYFQEVFVEHGIVLGMAALIASLGGLLFLLYRAVLSRNEFLHGLAFLNVVLFPPVLFSGAIYSVQAPYILAVSLLALGAHASTDRIYYRKTFPSMHSAPGFVAR